MSLIPQPQSQIAIPIAFISCFQQEEQCRIQPSVCDAISASLSQSWELLPALTPPATHTLLFYTITHSKELLLTATCGSNHGHKSAWL